MKPHKFTVITFTAVGLCLATALPGTSKILVSQASAAGAVAFSTEADMKKLIGRNIKNSAGDTIGEVESVYVDKSGKISSVIVGVGGFLGVGEREVAISWNDLQVTNDGKDVTTAMSKDQLKALPEYQYRQSTWRGTVFRD